MNLRTETEHRERWREVASQFSLVFGAAIFYFLVRGLTQGSVAQSEANAESILRLERWLGIDVEAGAQSLIVDHHAMVTLANWVYIWGHWPVIAVTLYALHRWYPLDYLRLRNALFVSGAIGIVIYMTFPVSPPRLLDPAYRDTVTQFSTSYRVLQPPALVNKYAAMPSLHAGWNLLAGIALYMVARRTVFRVAAAALPIAMALAVVFTANHYVLDVVVGEIVALTGLFLSQRWWPQTARSGPLDSAIGALSQRSALSQRADEVEIVDDQPAYAEIDQLQCPVEVVDGPRDDERRDGQQPVGHRSVDETLVDHDAVVVSPPSNPLHRPELPSVPDRAHGADVGTPATWP